MLRFPLFFFLETQQSIARLVKGRMVLLGIGLGRDRFFEVLFLIIHLVHGFTFSGLKDRWVSEVDCHGQFFLSRRLGSYDISLQVRSLSTGWISYIPRKVNIFSWRCWLDRLPTQLNLQLDAKGIDIPSVICGVCNSDMEDIMHLLISWDAAVALRSYVNK